MRDHHEFDTDDEFEDFGPSKSQRKRDSEAAQRLGKDIVELSDSQFRKIPLEGQLKDAIVLARKLNDREGRRRQLQFIGKLMRSEDLAPLQEAMAKLKSQSAKETGFLHLLERWRERLLSDDSALTELLTLYPHLDGQHVRTLIRQAVKEQEQNQPPKASRVLFRYLRDELNDGPAAN